MKEEDIEVAPEGKIFVCLACGKTATDVYGENASYGWDVSCSLNCKLFYKKDLVYKDGKVIRIKDDKN